MKIFRFLPLLMATAALPAMSQQMRSGYIDWGVRGPEFAEQLQSWDKGQRWTDDDNFFISRVKPHTRFRNIATQVHPELTEDVDKKLIFWVPINNVNHNAMPDGFFDSEVFPMWSYITHYGNWSTTVVRMPGGFADVAHKNGVPVSVVASIPYGQINTTWYTYLNDMFEAGPQKMADFLNYYGVDGLGYNSEFMTGKSLVEKINDYHAELYRLQKAQNPIAENIWYDGTSESGMITFDRGLGEHNDDIWGYGDNIKTSLFFNYNWNKAGLLESSVEYANKLGRSPLDLYCGINMQGREPKNVDWGIWPLMAQYPVSIGLWGAHSENMFYESRGDRGPSPDTRQRTYLRRMETWFTGGTANPVTSPALNNSLVYSEDNTDFPGMSKMMSARSALKWDLSQEPFISYFNLGNGKFMNWRGVRQHNSEWYNIAMQDYLPTWQWWFATKFIGREVADVAANGLKAQFVWDDAWVGGSLVRVYGTSTNEYLHLFKTEFALTDGDVITLRYKLVNGASDIALALSVKGDELTPVAENVLKVSQAAEPRQNEWVEKKFVVGQDIPQLSGKELAMVALHFENAQNLDIRLGEFSIVRGNSTSARPATPVVEKAEVLCTRHDGVDGKIIFNMPNDKPAGEVCYNLDVKTSMFRLYGQVEGEKPVMMGLTSSWAGLMFSVPTPSEPYSKVRFGVSALSLDMTKESDIAWSDWMTSDGKYEVSDDVVISRKMLKPNQPFSVNYADPLHKKASWQLLDEAGNIVAKADDTLGFDKTDGLPNPGNYTLVVDGYVNGTEGLEKKVLRMQSFVQITDPEAGNAPTITSLRLTPVDEMAELKENQPVKIEYTAEPGEATVSRALRVGETGIGFKAAEAGMQGKESFSVSFWFKADDFANKSVHMLNIRDGQDDWPKNAWGWCWHTMNEDGTVDALTVRLSSGENAVYRFGNTRLTPGIWHHITYVFDFESIRKFVPSFYVDGVKQDLTSWTKGDVDYTPEELMPVGTPYRWRDANVLSIGGHLHASGSVRGAIDNLMFWNKALNADEVKLAMGDFEEGKIPEALGGYFTFDNEPDELGGFPSLGTKELKGGANGTRTLEGEGKTEHCNVAPIYTAGCPFLDGDAYKLETKATLEAEDGRVYDIKGDNTAGQATAEFFTPGRHQVILTLANDYGQDTAVADIEVASSGVESITVLDRLQVSPAIFTDRIDITAPCDGNIRVYLYDLNGVCRLVNDFSALQGQIFSVFPEVENGVYILRAESANHPTAAVKVIKK